MNIPTSEEIIRRHGLEGKDAEILQKLVVFRLGQISAFSIIDLAQDCPERFDLERDIKWLDGEIDEELGHLQKHPKVAKALEDFLQTMIDSFK